jgi:hypothetical protein
VCTVFGKHAKRGGKHETVKCFERSKMNAIGILLFSTVIKKENQYMYTKKKKTVELCYE